MRRPPRALALTLAAATLAAPLSAQVAAVPQVAPVAGAVEVAPVAQSALKMMQHLETAAPRAAAAAVAPRVVPAPAPAPAVARAAPAVAGAAPQAQYGTVTTYVGQRLGISGAQAAKATSYLRSSPLFEQMKNPFRPANVGLAIGATAAVNLWRQAQAGEGVDMAEAMEFVKEPNFWGGVVGSGVAYAAVAAVAASFFPAGIGAVPALGVIFPMFAGLAGSLVGWELGSGLMQGRSMSDILGEVDFFQTVGQAAGSTAGLLAGASVGSSIGGALGSVAGPLGAIAGAVLLGPIGARLAGGVKAMLFGADDSELKTTVAEAQKVIGQLGAIQGAVSDIGLGEGEAQDAASVSVEASALKNLYDSARERLRTSLVSGDRDAAFHELQEMKEIARRYQDAVGEQMPTGR